MAAFRVPVERPVAMEFTMASGFRFAKGPSRAIREGAGLTPMEMQE